MAQTTSVMDLFLGTAEAESEMGDIPFHGSVVSAAPDATTYSVTRLGGSDCTLECAEDLERIFVNGPSTFARHFTKANALTWDMECKISGQTEFDCERTVHGPSADQGSYRTDVYVWATTSLTPVTITAGLEKILAVSTAASGTAQTAASASSGPSETGGSASATSSSSASSPSTTASGAAAGAGQNVVLAALCGAAALALGL